MPYDRFISPFPQVLNALRQYSLHCKTNLYKKLETKLISCHFKHLELYILPVYTGYSSRHKYRSYPPRSPVTYNAEMHQISSRVSFKLFLRCKHYQSQQIFKKMKRGDKVIDKTYYSQYHLQAKYDKEVLVCCAHHL